MGARARGVEGNGRTAPVDSVQCLFQASFPRQRDDFGNSFVKFGHAHLDQHFGCAARSQDPCNAPQHALLCFAEKVVYRLWSLALCWSMEASYLLIRNLSAPRAHAIAEPKLLQQAYGYQGTSMSVLLTGVFYRNMFVHRCAGDLGSSRCMYRR